VAIEHGFHPLNGGEAGSMALPRKKTRRMTVEGIAYHWIAAPNDGYITLVVECADAPGQRLEACFKYHDILLPVGEGAFRVVGQRRSVSPGAVRRIIQAALGRGWQPSLRGQASFHVLDAEQIAPIGDLGA
jgi:hypothetical protein